MAETLHGGVDAGGTSFRCIVATGPDDIVAEERFATEDPGTTLARAVRFFDAFGPGRLAGVGVACFGPLEVRPTAPDFGRILRTPKPGWSGADVLGAFRTLGPPVAIDTDVNAAAHAERLWGAGRGVPRAAYVTIGTGVGLGLADDGGVRPMMHAEAGHVLPRRRYDDQAFPGVCPFHGDCLEGLASGPALAARWGRPASELADDHPAWDLQAYYVAQLAAWAVLVAAADRVVIGGGVGQNPGLVPRVRRSLAAQLGDYADALDSRGGVDEVVRAAELGDRAGVLGGVAISLPR